MAALVELACLNWCSQVQERDGSLFRFVPGEIHTRGLEGSCQLIERLNCSGYLSIRDYPDRGGNGRLSLSHPADLKESRQG